MSIKCRLCIYHIVGRVSEQRKNELPTMKVSDVYMLIVGFPIEMFQARHCKFRARQVEEVLVDASRG